MRGADPGAAYFAAEALYAVAPAVLATVALDEIESLDAKLRRLAAASQWPDEGDALVRRGLSDRGRDTASRLAVAAAIEHERWSLLTAAAQSESVYSLHDLLLEAAALSHEPMLVQGLIEWTWLGESPSDRRLLRAMVERQREQPSRLLALLFQNTPPRTPQPEDLPAYLASLRYLHTHDLEAHEILTTALRLAPAAERASIEQHAAKRRGVSAAVAHAVLAIAWHDAEAHASLLDKARAAINGGAMHGELRPDIGVALAALSLIGTPDDAAALVEAAGDTQHDDWDQQIVQGELLAFAASIDPQTASPALQGKDFQLWNRPVETSAHQLRAEAAATTAGWTAPAAGPGGTEWPQGLQQGLHADARRRRSRRPSGHPPADRPSRPVGVALLHEFACRGRCAPSSGPGAFPRRGRSMGSRRVGGGCGGRVGWTGRGLRARGIDRVLRKPPGLFLARPDRGDESLRRGRFGATIPARGTRQREP